MKSLDAHVHLWYNDNGIEAIEKEFGCIKEHFKYDKFHFLSVPHHDSLNDPTQNIRTLYLKDRLSSYASASLFHHFDERDTRASFLKQAMLYDKMGFDGYKMLEGKPLLRKETGFRLDAEIYWDFYEYAESKEIPIVLHAADPESAWDIEKATEYQIMKGWVCDETFPTKEEIRQEVWGIMEKFPKLKLTLAHFGFLYFNKNLLVEFLERWENTALDLVIGADAMNMLTQDDKWCIDFFENYNERLIFGTDLYPFNFNKEKRTYEQVTPRVGWIREFLESDSKILGEGQGFSYRGLNLPEYMLKGIYFENHERRYGEPKKINPALVLEECAALLDNKDDLMTEQMFKDINIIKEYFELR